MIRKLFLFICVISLLSCEKKNVGEIVDQKWVLTSATASPGIPLNGKTETNYMTLPGAKECLNYNYTITFNRNGTYAITSNGPLCDMIANSDKQKWTKDGDQVTLTSFYTTPIVATLKGNKLSYSMEGTMYNVKQIINYQFEAK